MRSRWIRKVNGVPSCDAGICSNEVVTSVGSVFPIATCTTLRSSRCGNSSVPLVAS